MEWQYNNLTGAFNKIPVNDAFSLERITDCGNSKRRSESGKESLKVRLSSSNFISSKNENIREDCSPLH